MSERLLVVGGGKVGRGLAAAFRSAGLSVLGVHARTAREGATSSGPLVEPVDRTVGSAPGSRQHSSDTLATVLGDANVIIVAVADNAIDRVCKDLLLLLGRNPRTMAQGTVVLNTSGSVTPGSYSDLRALGFPCGTFHPLAPFATAERGALAVRDGWIGIEGDPTACATARRLAAALGARTVSIPAHAKAAYHAAAVIASNFPVVLAALATRLLASVGVDERTGAQVVQQLMRAAVNNLEVGAPAAMLTGPAARNDIVTIAAHRDTLAADVEMMAVYDALTRAARSLAAEHTPLVDDAGIRGRREAKRGSGD